MNYWSYFFANNCDIIMICGFKYMFMDVRNSFEIVLTNSIVLGVTMFQNCCENGYQKPISQKQLSYHYNDFWSFIYGHKGFI